MSNEPLLVRWPILTWAPAVFCLALGGGTPWLVGLRENCVLQLCLSAWFCLAMGLASCSLVYISSRVAKKPSPFADGMNFVQQVAHFGIFIVGLLVAAQLYVWSCAGRNVPPCGGVFYADAAQLLTKLWIVLGVACVAMLVGRGVKSNLLLFALLIVIVATSISMAACLYSKDREAMVYIWQLGSVAAGSMLVGSYVEDEQQQAAVADDGKAAAGAA